MKINIFQIAKSEKDLYEPLVANFLKMSSKYAKIEIHNLFNNTIAKQQSLGEREAKRAYSDVFVPKLSLGYNIALDPLGKRYDSFGFAKFFEDKTTVNLFIGGAYGFEEGFLDKCDVILSLSELTMAHKIAHLVLMEQIFRSMCILHNHPYHK